MRSLTTVDPATGEPLADYPLLSLAEARGMVREARRRREKDPGLEYAAGVIASGKPSPKSSR